MSHSNIFYPWTLRGVEYQRGIDKRHTTAGVEERLALGSAVGHARVTPSNFLPPKEGVTGPDPDLTEPPTPSLRGRRSSAASSQSAQVHEGEPALYPAYPTTGDRSVGLS